MGGRQGLARVMLAFLLAPPVPGLVIALAGATYFTGAGARVNPSDFFGLAAVCALIGYPVAFLLGLPAYHILRALGLDGSLVYAMAGVAFGGLVFVITPLLPGFAPVTLDLVLLPIAMVMGLAATLAFWFIARPDRYPRTARADQPSAI